MKLLSLAIPLMFSALFFQGCRDKSQATLSNAELLRVMDGEVFEIKLPADIQKNDLAGLAIRYADGRMDPLTRSTGWIPDSTVKVVCLRLPENRFQTVCFTETGHLRATRENFPKSSSHSTSSKTRGLVPDEMLIRYSGDNTVKFDGLPEEDDFDIIFHVEKKNR